MGKIIRNGIKYSGTTNSADKINYNNTLSGLEAETAQEAFDELNTKIKNGGNIEYLTQAEYDALPESKLTDGIEYRITDANTDSTKARNIAYDNSESGIEAVSVQDAIDSINDNLEGVVVLKDTSIVTLTNSVTAGKFSAVNSGILKEDNDICICNQITATNFILSPYVNVNGYWCCIMYNASSETIQLNTATIKFTVLKH